MKVITVQFPLLTNSYKVKMFSGESLDENVAEKLFIKTLSGIRRTLQSPEDPASPVESMLIFHKDTRMWKRSKDTLQTDKELDGQQIKCHSTTVS